MLKKAITLGAVFAVCSLPAHAGSPTDQFRYSAKTLKGLVTEGYQIAGYSTSNDPVSHALRSDYVLQKKASVYLCSDNYRYKAATRELACYELVEPFDASER